MYLENLFKILFMWFFGLNNFIFFYSLHNFAKTYNNQYLQLSLVSLIKFLFGFNTAIFYASLLLISYGINYSMTIKNTFMKISSVYMLTKKAKKIEDTISQTDNNFVNPNSENINRIIKIGTFLENLYVHVNTKIEKLELSESYFKIQNLLSEYYNYLNIDLFIERGNILLKGICDFIYDRVSYYGYNENLNNLNSTVQYWKNMHDKAELKNVLSSSKNIPMPSQNPFIEQPSQLEMLENMQKMMEMFEKVGKIKRQ